MEIDRKIDGQSVVMSVKGRLDTVTAPELQTALNGLAAEVTAVTLDFAALDYISSAGLRVLLTANKHAVATGGTFVVANANESVRDVFDMTGFSDILTLK